MDYKPLTVHFVDLSGMHIQVVETSSIHVLGPLSFTFCLVISTGLTCGQHVHIYRLVYGTHPGFPSLIHTLFVLSFVLSFLFSFFLLFFLSFFFFIFSFLRSFIDSSVHSFVRSFLPSFIPSFLPSFIQPFVRWFFNVIDFMLFHWHLNNHFFLRWCTSQVQSFIASASDRHSCKQKYIL